MVEPPIVEYDPHMYLEDFIAGAQKMVPEVRCMLDQLSDKEIQLQCMYPIGNPQMPFINAKLAIEKKTSSAEKWMDEYWSTCSRYEEETLLSNLSKDHVRAKRISDERITIATNALNLVELYLNQLQEDLTTMGVDFDAEPASRESNARRKGASTPEDDEPDMLLEDDDDKENESEPVYCFCREASYGAMVACDYQVSWRLRPALREVMKDILTVVAQNCPYEWFHYGCVRLRAPPKGEWYCPACELKLRDEQMQNEMDKKSRKLGRESGRRK
ncbi:Histone acetyltransferase complex subunit [Borealophlyctis nickersoniae]|nr:Histone acetyltransferase complex subunit [Borealophlyctis nickersoniae]